MTELDELVKIRKILEFFLEEHLKKREGAEFESAKVSEVTK